jgi:hypothetical protein
MDAKNTGDAPQRDLQFECVLAPRRFRIAVPRYPNAPFSCVFTESMQRLQNVALALKWTSTRPKSSAAVKRKPESHTLPGPSSHEPASLLSGSNGLLDRRQRFFASRSPGGPKAPAQLSQPGARSRADPCQLAQSNRFFFSILQHKVLTANDFSSLHELAERLLAFERHYETIAQPFEWRFTRQDLMRMLRKLGHAALKAA